MPTYTTKENHRELAEKLLAFGETREDVIHIIIKLFEQFEKETKEIEEHYEKMRESDKEHIKLLEENQQILKQLILEITTKSFQIQGNA